jgi:hypothetical protein
MRRIEKKRVNVMIERDCLTNPNEVDVTNSDDIQILRGLTQVVRYSVEARTRSKRADMILCGFLILVNLLGVYGSSYADDYALDPAPIARHGRYEQPFESAQDPNVCSIYLQNLQYFAHRKLPMSCGQPIAPTLTAKIKPVEWEDLDPDQYPDLFKAVVADYEHGSNGESRLAGARKAVTKKAYVFRRAKLDLSKSPLARRRLGDPPAAQFQIVQFGIDITDPNSPPDQWGHCEPKQGRSSSRGPVWTPIYRVSADLQRLYGGLIGLINGSVRALWIVNDNVYAESYYPGGADVELSELRVNSPLNVDWNPVCRFHYTRSANATKE